MFLPVTSGYKKQTYFKASFLDLASNLKFTVKEMW